MRQGLPSICKRIVTVDNHEAKLTPKEYDLLRILVTHAGKVITHQHLLREVGARLAARNALSACTSGNSARSSNLIRPSPVTSSPSQEWAIVCGWRTRGICDVQPGWVIHREIGAGTPQGV